MCTATWLTLPAPGTYEFYFNRDESRLRGRAAPPAVLQRNGVEGKGDAPEILAPRDSDAGGTWIAANDRGVTVCLLNRYQDADRIAVPKHRRRSRGLLVLDLASSEDVADLERGLGRQQLDRYPAFTVVAAEPGSTPRAFHWTGRELLDPEPLGPGLWPVSSSGYDAPAAERARRELWKEISKGTRPPGGTPEQALELHRSHRPERGALSPCMHRRVASTVSLTVVRVEPDRVGMRYADGPPCTSALAEPVWLPRTP